MSTSSLAVKLFVGELHKKVVSNRDTVSTEVKQDDAALKTRSLVAQGRWSLFAVQFLHKTVRARKSGCWKQVVAKARFYCTTEGSMKMRSEVCE